jgi:hypothetical protein
VPPLWHLVEERRATAVVESACPAGIIAIMLVCPKGLSGNRLAGSVEADRDGPGRRDGSG